MLTKYLNTSLLELSLLLVVLTTSTFCIYTPDILTIKWGANYAPQLMLFYFGLGLVLLAFNKPKLTFTSFACAGALCLFLKETSHTEMKHAIATDYEEVTIAHFNLANSESDYGLMVASILETNADVISIQELSLDWMDVLNEGLSAQYPYEITIPDLGLNGIAIYSKYEITEQETFYYDNIPNIKGRIDLSATESFYFISSHTLPALNTKSYKQLREHLAVIQAECNKIDAPLIAFGDYHSVSWSKELRELKENTLLNDSRRLFTPSFPSGFVDFLEVPIDHIFYSDDFKCTTFTALNGETSPHLGIMGTYELLDPTKTYSSANLYHNSGLAD